MALVMLKIICICQVIFNTATFTTALWTPSIWIVLDAEPIVQAYLGECGKPFVYPTIPPSF